MLFALNSLPLHLFLIIFFHGIDNNFRSHAIVLLSRLGGFNHELAEELLRPHAPLFEYWGHEASWMPIELYPVFEFRRKASSNYFCRH